MHSLEICHRDIKLDNLIYEPGAQTVKIIDFGFAVTGKERLRVPYGTPAFMAPEITMKKEYKG
jgi:serine/threonine protein kinase